MPSARAYRRHCTPKQAPDLGKLAFEELGVRVWSFWFMVGIVLKN